MIIAKHFEFEASHKLPDDECYGKCKNLHGHTYKLTVEVQGPINSKGWVINFKDLKEIVNELIIDKYDHGYLNDYFEISTAEIMAQKMFNDLYIYFEDNYKDVQVHSIKLYETSNSYAYINNYEKYPGSKV